MQAEIRTTKGIKLTIDTKWVKFQTKVLTTSVPYYELTLTMGGKVNTFEPIQELPIIERDERPTKAPTKAPIIAMVSMPQVKTIPTASECPSVISGSWRGVKIEVEDAEEKYKGEMLWSVKTSPEIIIADKKTGRMVKDTDMTKLTKRR